MARVGGARSWPFGARAPAGAGSGRLLAAVARQLEAEQERWFLWLPVLFGSGIALYFALPTEPPALVALMPAVAALGLHLARPRTGLVGLITSALLAATLGIAVAKLRTEWVRAPVLQGSLQSQTRPIDIYGHLELIEPRPGKGQRLTIRVTAMEKHEAHAWPARVRVVTRAENKAVRPGDAVRLKATLNPPPGPSLPGDYDFARAAWFQSLGAVGYADAAAEIDTNARSPPIALRLAAAVARVRQAIGGRILAALPGETGAIANALVTGERGGISEATNQAFRDSGLFHILSISGLHMVIMAGAVFLSIRLGLAAIPAIALRYPIKKWAAAGAMLGAFCYLMISGAAFATVRSYVMISIMFLAVLLDRPAIALRNVALAALAILLLWPESLLDAGFQMSFAAVVALVSTYEWLRLRDAQRDGPARRGWLGRGLLFLGGILTTTLVASLAVAPFGIYHFHNTQAFAMLANLLAIPICNLLVMPAALAALVAMPLGLEAVPLWVMGLGIEAMVWCAHTVSGLPGAVGRVPAIPTLAFALIVAGGLWCALWGMRWRLLGVVPIAAGLMLAPTGQRPDVLIGRGASLVAIRGPDGRLSAVAGRGSAYELARWLEHDGDGRPPTEAGKASAFRCDQQGCIAHVRGLRLAVSKSPAALRDDCTISAILVLTFPRPARCRPAGPVIDIDDLAARGAHALTVKHGKALVETVADARGDRPWAATAGKPITPASAHVDPEEDHRRRRKWHDR
ncbi:MAG TPA: ComEC/Rec2 family competence protein [Hyphomicrobiaceae bacterium]|jgi:competence protein ComEC|nr:ComEC/Rec2 family competence protein [Hyphomicrobiaceae bacterium]